MYQKALDAFEKSASAESLYQLAEIYHNGKGVAVDKNKAQRYADEALKKGHRNAAALLQEITSKANRTTANETRYSESADYSQKKHVVSSSDDGCFITTATCQAEGKPDDCPELTAFRSYRDNVLLKTAAGKQLVQEYYRIAPQIVELIQNDPNAEKIYRHLYDTYILPGYLLLQSGKGSEAKELYELGVRKLAAYYHIPASDNTGTKEDPIEESGYRQSDF